MLIDVYRTISCVILAPRYPFFKPSSGRLRRLCLYTRQRPPRERLRCVPGNE
jgi:hypothetical protein